jgi:hypothetical protein
MVNDIFECFKEIADGLVDHLVSMKESTLKKVGTDKREFPTELSRDLN